MEDELLKKEFDISEKGLDESVKEMEESMDIDIEEEKSNLNPRPRAEELIEKFRENERSLKSGEMNKDLVKDLKQIEESEEKNLKDADRRFLEMVDEAEQMIEKTLKVGDRNLEEEF